MQGTMQTVWFIRHGESEANAGQVTFNHREVSLTARGKLQAQYIAQAFSTPPSLIVTSPYIRTKQTAEPSLMRFPESQCEEWPIHEFSYLAPSRCENTSVQQRRPMVEEYWQRGDPYHRDDNAESFADLLDRIAFTLAEVKRRQEPFIAIFSHGLFIRTMLWVLLSGNTEVSGLTMRRSRAFCESVLMPNAAILKMKLAEDGELFLSQFVTSHLPDHLHSM